ncbi:hypothetical protein OH687_35165 [Burkholderia anthina]|nr:hypothetical protein OH687_35165 [Burkholderia anthina]
MPAQTRRGVRRDVRRRRNAPRFDIRHAEHRSSHVAPAPISGSGL